MRSSLVCFLRARKTYQVGPDMLNIAKSNELFVKIAIVQSWSFLLAWSGWFPVNLSIDLTSWELVIYTHIKTSWLTVTYWCLAYVLLCLRLTNVREKSSLCGRYCATWSVKKLSYGIQKFTVAAVNSLGSDSKQNVFIGTYRKTLCFHIYMFLVQTVR